MSYSAIFVFSQNTSLSELIRQIETLSDVTGKVLCLSTHDLFVQEKHTLQDRFGHRCEYKAFADCINREEMEFLDAEADRLILGKYGYRRGKLAQYQEQLNILKNRFILERISTGTDVGYKKVLNNDLGIYAPVWLAEGFDGNFYVPECLPQKRGVLLFVSRIHGAVKKLTDKTPVWQVFIEDRRYIFLGRPDRIEQYMAPEVGIAPLGRRDEIVWGQIFRFGSFIGARQQLLSKIASALTRFVFDFFVRKKTELEFITPIHEQRDAFGDISKVLGIPLNYLQDGFLPGNFSSCYLKYIHNPACFLVWDRASSGIFIKHGLPWRCSLLFADTRLPLVQRDPGPIKKILYLASGAGDWTAVKNRSDEDRAFETFIEVARRLPEVQVVFRPHPLWADPNMQGLESLERIANYVSQLGIPNFHMSGGALSDSKGFKRDKQVSRKSSSIQGEIADAEVVFGDHSQTMIIAARQGKIMASVNVSRRESLFSSFSYYGFPCLQTADDVINFILSLGNSSAAIAAYNLAVAGYNQSGAGPTH